MKRKILISAFITIVVTSSFCNVEHRLAKHKDYVPDETTAIKIAEAVWLPIYGESIYVNRPFVATLEKGIWLVTGTLPEGYFGGTATIKISKYDCRILDVSRPK